VLVETHPDKPVLIVDPTSGGATASHYDLVGHGAPGGSEPVVFERGDDLSALAAAAIEGGADVIGMAGGDGSQMAVAAVAAEGDVSSSAFRWHRWQPYGAMITDLIPQVGGFFGGAPLGLLALTQRRVCLCRCRGPVWPLPDPREPCHQPGGRRTRGQRLAAESMLATLIGAAAAGVAGALVATPLVGATKRLYLQLRWGQQPFVSERPPLRDRVKTAFPRMLRRSRPTPRGGDR
jgi:hypothetical protein